MGAGQGTRPDTQECGGHASHSRDERAPCAGCACGEDAVAAAVDFVELKQNTQNRMMGSRSRALSGGTSAQTMTKMTVGSVSENVNGLHSSGCGNAGPALEPALALVGDAGNAGLAIVV